MPFGLWVLKHGDLRAVTTESLYALSGRGIVKRAFVHAVLQELLPLHPGYYGEMVWILMLLEHWLRARPTIIAEFPCS